MIFLLRHVKYTMMEVESGLEKGDIFVLNGMVTENGNVYVYVLIYIHYIGNIFRYIRIQYTLHM